MVYSCCASVYLPVHGWGTSDAVHWTLSYTIWIWLLTVFPRPFSPHLCVHPYRYIFTHRRFHAILSGDWLSNGCKILLVLTASESKWNSILSRHLRKRNHIFHVCSVLRNMLSDSFYRQQTILSLFMLTNELYGFQSVYSARCGACTIVCNGWVSNNREPYYVSCSALSICLSVYVFR